MAPPLLVAEIRIGERLAECAVGAGTQSRLGSPRINWLLVDERSIGDNPEAQRATNRSASIALGMFAANMRPITRESR
jgi:hypothetical protein